MAGAKGPIIGRQVTLYMTTLSDKNNLRGVVAHTKVAIADPTVDVREDTTTGSAINKKAITKVAGLVDIGAKEATRDVIEYSEFGDERVKKVAGQVNSGDFTFSLAYNPTNLYHLALRAAPDNEPPVVTTFAARADEDPSAASPTKFTHFMIDGVITTASLTSSTDAVTQLDVTVSVTNGPTQVDN